MELNESENKVLQWVKEHGDSMLGEMFPKLPMKRTTCHENLVKLQAKGFLQVVREVQLHRKGRYTQVYNITKEGMNYEHRPDY